MAGCEDLVVGGGLALHDTEASVSRSLIGDNVANRGGGLFAMGGCLTVEAGTIAGNQAFRWVGAAALTGPGEVGFLAVGGNTIIRASNDADAAAELEIQLTGSKALIELDFYL